MLDFSRISGVFHENKNAFHGPRGTRELTPSNWRRAPLHCRHPEPRKHP
jgi:hypothetical protein